MRDIIPPAGPGSVPGPSPSWTYPVNLPWETTGGHSCQMPKPPQLTHFNVKGQRLLLRVHHGYQCFHQSLTVPDTLQRNLISAACICDLVLSVTTQSL
ncbi:hypothetical protein LDENG_00062630 [Lucifuga dentata]|nr:hypothetical protein LDENG_00062630 [Lucifuga dentata]